MELYNAVPLSMADRQEEMEGVAALSVPMKADSAAGQSWAEAKE